MMVNLAIICQLCFAFKPQFVSKEFYFHKLDKLYIPYFRYYKTVLYLFLRPFGASFRPRTRFFLASLELLVRLQFKGVFYSRASYNSGNTVDCLLFNINFS